MMITIRNSGKTEDELAEYLMQKEEDWGIEIEYGRPQKVGGV